MWWSIESPEITKDSAVSIWSSSGTLAPVTALNLQSETLSREAGK